MTDNPGRATARSWVEIDADALAHNIGVLKRQLGQTSGTRLLGVVKADAYGHGVDIIAPLYVQNGIDEFGVATVDEGAHLRELLGPEISIYILAPTLENDALLIVSHQLIPFVSDLALARAISDNAASAGQTATIHMEVDTGMGRAGVALSSAELLLSALDALPNLRVTGLATHFANADEDACDAKSQYAQFVALVAQLGDRAHSLTLHASNSPGVIAVPSARLNMARPGLLLYGIEPAAGMFAEAGWDLRPVLRLKSRVLLCRTLAPGATISYGRTYTVPDEGGTFATLGIGYGDGWPRGLSNIGSVLLHGRQAPIRGRVCMDVTVVDVTDIPEARAGDIATLIGGDGTESLTVGAIASLLQTTPHAVTTCLTARLPRILLSNKSSCAA